MKTYFSWLTFLLLWFPVCRMAGQASFENPVDYMHYLSQREEMLSRKYLSYMSEVAHGHRAMKMEKLREELLHSIREAISDAEKLRPYKGDILLRGTFKEYWSILHSVFSEDYHKIADMEEVAERSYDGMEAYLLSQEEANQKLDEAYAKIPPAYEAFARKHNIQFSEAQSSKLSRRLEQAGQVNEYMNTVYLIFFKSTVQESLMVEAIRSGDTNTVRHRRNDLLKYAREGLLKLDSLKPFKADGSLIAACRKVLEFQEDEALDKLTAYTDFMLKHEVLEQLQKSLENKPAHQRTQTDVEAYNSMVSQYNKSLNDYRKTFDELNTSRMEVMNNWEVTRKKFMDIHIPYKI